MFHKLGRAAFGEIAPQVGRYSVSLFIAEHEYLAKPLNKEAMFDFVLR